MDKEGRRRKEVERESRGKRKEKRRKRGVIRRDG